METKDKNFERWKRWCWVDFLIAQTASGWPLLRFERQKLHGKIKRELNTIAGERRTTFHCAACSRLLFFEDATLEHIIPVSLGGTYERSNLTLTCAACNRKRGNKHDFWIWRIWRHEHAHRAPVPIFHWSP